MAQMTQLPADLARIVASPDSYAQWDMLHDALCSIRQHYPFAKAEIDGYHPFWVASKFDDIRAIARNNEVFKSGMGAILSNEMLAFEKQAGIGSLFRSIVAMNEPDHHKYRMLTQKWFQPKSLRQLENNIHRLARQWVERLLNTGGECEFVSTIAVHYPLFVVMSILGVPDEDEPMMLRLTQEYFGNNDRDLNRQKGASLPTDAMQTIREVITETREYFAAISEDRRRYPKNDLASVIANAKIDDEPVNDIDAMGYYITVAFAGHDTTSSTLSGAIWALAENPAQLHLLQQNPTLIPNFVEEAVRWVSPVHQFTRVAAKDIDIRGQQVQAGDWVILCFPSGNRDEDVFEAPFKFRVDRPKTTHVGFGYGPHMCLGMHLARMELQAFFSELLPHIKSIELTGKPTRTVTNFVGGPKSLPVRFSFN